MRGNSFYSRRLHSLLGVIPLCLFFVTHALTNFQAAEGGPERFRSAVNFINNLPILPVLEFVLIWVPLVFHGIYGLYVAYQSNLNTGRYGYGRNWAFALQRISGVITLIFVSWHVYETRIQVMLGNIGHEDFGQVMHNIATNGLAFALYTIGVLAAAFHFANGLWAFFVSWGVTVGPRAQRVSSWFWMGVFVIVAGMFLAALIAFRSEAFADTAADLAQTAIG
jgi:succinate dehydrogenase / fumarate reductase cytochrome b subunit